MVNIRRRQTLLIYKRNSIVTVTPIVILERKKNENNWNKMLSIDHGYIEMYTFTGIKTNKQKSKKTGEIYSIYKN